MSLTEPTPDKEDIELLTHVDYGGPEEDKERSEESPLTLTIDEVLEQINGFGRYQKFIFFLMSCCYISCAMINLSQVMLERSPPIECVTPNGTLCPESEACDQPNTWRFLTSRSLHTTNTVVAEWDLVCGSAWKKGLIGSVFFTGFAIGSTLGGYLSEKLGRKRAVFVTLVIQILGGCSFLASSYEVYLIFRLVAGIGVGGIIVTAFVLMMEFIGTAHRGFCGGAGINGLWAMGGVFCVPIALLLDSFYIEGSSYDYWRAFQIVLVIPSVLLLFTWRLVPESSRYLLVKGKSSQALAVLSDVARTNNRTMPHTQLAEVTTDSTQSTFVLLWSRRRSLRRPLWRTTLCLSYSWLACSFVYYGMSLNAGNLGGSFYINVFINFVVDVPALLLSVPMLDRIGRQRVLAATLLLSAAICLVFTFMPLPDGCDADHPCTQFTARLVLAFTGKFSIAIAFADVFVYTSEVYPTQVRSSGLGFCSLLARVGGIAAPLVVSVRAPGYEPMLIFAIVSLTAGLACLLLPETLHQQLQETVED